MNKCLRKQEDINNIIIYKAKRNSQLPRKQRKKEFFSMKNAEEERNMPWPKLKKTMKHEYHGLKVHCPLSLKTTNCLAAWQFMQHGQDILRPLFPKTVTSSEHPAENVCEREVLNKLLLRITCEGSRPLTLWIRDWSIVQGLTKDLKSMPSNHFLRTLKHVKRI